MNQENTSIYPNPNDFQKREESVIKKRNNLVFPIVSFLVILTLVLVLTFLVEFEVIYIDALCALSIILQIIAFRKSDANELGRFLSIAFIFVSSVALLFFMIITMAFAAMG